MSELYKCGNCKSIFIELYKFLEHQSECNFTTLTPLTNVNTEGTPSVTSFAAAILNCHDPTNDPTVLAISHQQNQHEMQQQLLLHKIQKLQHFQQQQPQFEKAFQSHCKTIIDISTAQNVLKQDVTTIKTEFKHQKVVDPSIIDYHIITKLAEETKANNKQPKKSRKKREKIPFDPNAPKKIRIRKKAIRKKACELSRSFQCKICGRSFRRNKLKDHMQIHLVWPDSLEGNIGTGNFDELAGNYICNYCPERVESFVQLRSHIHALHKDVKVYMCPMSECRQLFGFQDVMIEHSKGCAFKSNVQCPICYQYFSVIRQLEIHILEHEKEIDNEIKIQQLSQQSPSEPIRIALEMITNLDITKNIINEKVVPNGADGITKPTGNYGDPDELHPLQCPVCFVKYKSKIMLLNHLHTDTHHHECEVCQKVFLHRRQLRMHSHTHRNLQCVCPICNRSFKMQKMLKSHMLTHTDQKFFCDICGSVSTLKSNLVKHFKTHSNQMEKCGLNGCKRMFRSMDRLNSHRIMHKKQIKASGRKIKIKKAKTRRQSTDSSDDDNNKIKRINRRQPVSGKKNVVIPGIVVEGGKITKGIDIVQEYTLFGLNNIIKGQVKDDEYIIKTNTTSASPNNKITIQSELIKDELDDDDDDDADDDDDDADGDGDNADGDDDHHHEAAWVEIDYMPEVKVEFVELVEEPVTISDDNKFNNKKNDVNSNFCKTTEIYTESNNSGNGVLEKDKISVSVPVAQQQLKRKNLSKIQNQPSPPSSSTTNNSDDSDNKSILELPDSMIEKSKKNIPNKPKRKYDSTKRRNKETVANQPKTDKVKRPKRTKKPLTPKKERDNLFTVRLGKGTRHVAGIAECNVCGRHFKTTAATKHIEAHRVWTFSKKTHIGSSTFDSNDKVYRCPYCPASFQLHPKLRSHMNQNHVSEKVFACPLSKCMKLFVGDHEFIAHCRECVFNSADNVRCPICHKFFIGDEELNTHKIIAHEMVNNNSDVEHNNDDNGGPKDTEGDGNQSITSTVPGKQLDGKGDTINNLTAKPNKVRCTICHEPFKDKIMLVKHMHRDSHDHRCIYCGKEFLSLRKVRRHYVKHRNAPAVCYICGKLFDCKDTLNTHVRTHTIRYTCDICQKKFVQKAAMSHHLKMHDVPLYRCPHEGCKCVRRNKALMEKHLENHNKKKVRRSRRSRNKNSEPTIDPDPNPNSNPNRITIPYQIGSQFDVNSYY